MIVTMKKLTLTLLICGALLAASSCTSKNDSKDMAEEQNDQKFEDTDVKKDADFAVTAAEGGLMEVQLGQLAQSNASSPQVKEFAQRMVEDHGKANDELRALAQQKNITLPTSLSEKHQKKFNELNDKKAEDFDKAYIDFMVDDHQEDIDAFQKEADKGTDADLKSWAAAKVPTLQHHLDMAKAAQDALKETRKNNK